MNKGELDRTKNAIDVLLKSLQQAVDGRDAQALQAVIAGGVLQLCSQLLHVHRQLQELIERE